MVVIQAAVLKVDTTKCVDVFYFLLCYSNKCSFLRALHYTVHQLQFLSILFLRNHAKGLLWEEKQAL